MGGEAQRVGEKFATFSPVGGHSKSFINSTGEFGQFTTDDPETIAFLDARMAKMGDGADVFGPEKYSRISMTPDQLVGQLDAEVRELQTKNQLLNDLVKSKGIAAK